MFTNFRRKLNSVIQENFNITPSSSSSSSSLQENPISINNNNNINNKNNSNNISNVSTQNINVYAGCKLLEIYEKQWHEIHLANEQNAEAANEIDQLIQNLNDNSQIKLIAITDLNQSLVILPSICSTLETCMKMLSDIDQQSILVEEKLLEFEDLFDVLELQEHQLNHRFEMAMYKEKKLGKLERVRQELADKHAASVKDYENQLRLVQQERQAVFQDAFQNDINFYKESGSIPKIEHLSTQSELTLEEIVLDNRDTEELDQFLNN